MRIKKFCGLLILSFIIIILNIKNTYVYATNKTNKHSHQIPNVVYLATTFKPEKIFKSGFVRPRNKNSNLILHVEKDLGNRATSMISTTSNLDHATRYAEIYARKYWNTEEYYIYEIIPQNNFIDVAATYERTLQETTDLGKKAGLETLREYFTKEFEYIALYSISSKTILSATKYLLNHETGSYERQNTIKNENAQQNITPELHPNNYPLGTLDGLDYPLINNNCLLNTNYITKSFIFNTNTSPNPLLKQYTLEKMTLNEFCLNNYFQNKKNTKFEFKFPIKIQLKNIYEKKYCLTTFPYNNVKIAQCSESPNWYFTQFGQIITELYDNKSDQYYCLTEINENENNSYVKVQICDITNKNQLWKVESNNLGQNFIKSRSNKIFHAYDNIYQSIYLTDKINKDILFLDNINVLNTKQTEPFIQFSINPLKTKNSETIYPTQRGNAYSIQSELLKGYRNYYNAHSNILFSTYENYYESQAICYYSSMMSTKLKSWGWVKSNYCSTIFENNLKFKWILHKKTENNKYQISNIGGNILRINKNPTPYLNYLYTINTAEYHDNDQFVQDFLFNTPAQIFANRVGSIEKNYVINTHKLIDAFNGLRNYYYNIYINKTD